MKFRDISKKRRKGILAGSSALIMGMTSLMGVCCPVFASDPPEGTEKIILRVCNWEEYIDLGDWDEEEVIDLDSGDIFGENSMVDRKSVV